MLVELRKLQHWPSALADIARRRINGKTDAKKMWAAVRQLTGRRQEARVVAGITAESLNEHYAAISTDANYMPPLLKHSTAVF